MRAADAKRALDKLATPERAKASARFFKTGPGQDGEGDRFIGVSVPEQRKVAKQFSSLPIGEVVQLLHSPVHEHRLTALFILVHQFKKGGRETRKSIAGIYHKNRAFIDNWDLVDSSAPYILGEYLRDRSRDVLLRLASARSLWDRRIAVLSTAPWIREGDFDWTLRLCELLLDDREDLIHKACGWMLREVGQRDRATLLRFLDAHRTQMPRTMLRYAIEKLSPAQRRQVMG